MAGHLDFGNDRHVMRRGIGDDFTGVVLGQETAVRAAIPASGRCPLPPGVANAPGTFLQFRMGLDLQPPAGRIGQMQVQHIELHLGKGVYLLEDKVLVPEMPGDVQHRTSPGEPGIVDDDAAVIRLLQLRQRRPGPVHALGRIGLDQDPLGRDGNAIGLFPGESRQLGAPLGKGPLPFGDFHFLGLGDAVAHLIRNGRRENPQRRK